MMVRDWGHGEPEKHEPVEHDPIDRPRSRRCFNWPIQRKEAGL